MRKGASRSFLRLPLLSLTTGLVWLLPSLDLPPNRWRRTAPKTFLEPVRAPGALGGFRRAAPRAQSGPAGAPARPDGRTDGWLLVTGLVRERNSNPGDNSLWCCTKSYLATRLAGLHRGYFQHSGCRLTVWRYKNLQHVIYSCL